MTRHLRISIPLPALIYISAALLISIALWAFLAVAASYDDEQDIVMIWVPPGREVRVERRKTDMSRNIFITVNRGDLVIINGVRQ